MIKRIFRWTLRIVCVTLALLVALLAAGAAYQSIVTNREQAQYPPLGRMVDVGGHRLHLLCSGQGSPTVILESGIGMASPVWGWVEPRLQSLTRVCSYDRAGMGWSEAGPLPRDGQQIVRELQALLQRASIEGPYLLAGHSFGGRLVRLYAARYPEEVAGLVLVDTPPDDLYLKLSQRFPEQFEALTEAGLETANRLRISSWVGLPRLIPLTGGNLDRFPEELQQRARVIRLWSRAFEANYAEMISNRQTMSQLEASDWSLGDRPLAVIAAGPPPASDPLPEDASVQMAWATWWRQGQSEMLQRSTESRLIYAEKSGHNVQFDAPEVVVEAISWALNVFRSRLQSR